VIQKRERRRANGSTYAVWRVRWEEAGRERSRTFDRLKDARAFEAKVRTLKRSDDLAELDAGTETLAEFAEEWWRVYARPNLERSTMKNYAQLWNKHGLSRLGDLRLRDVSPRVVADFRLDLERSGVGPAAVRKTLAVLQSMLQRAVERERIRSNPVRAVRKPSARRQLAVHASPPEEVERLRSELGLRDATLGCVLAYAGLRPQEALALQWRHVRERTLLVEQAATDGRLKGQKTNRPPRSVDLLAPLRDDLAAWRSASSPPHTDVYLFARADGGLWREDDWRTWRKRHFAPAAQAIGMTSPRAYDLRHSFASLLIHEGRLSIVELAEQMGHNATMCLSTYAHVMAELRGAPKVSAEEQIWAARAAVKRVRRNAIRPKSGPRADPRTTALRGFGSRRESRRGDSNPGDPFITRSTLETTFARLKPKPWWFSAAESGHICRVVNTFRDMLSERLAAVGTLRKAPAGPAKCTRDHGCAIAIASRRKRNWVAIARPAAHATGVSIVNGRRSSRVRAVRSLHARGFYVPPAFGAHPTEERRGGPSVHGRAPVPGAERAGIAHEHPHGSVERDGPPLQGAVRARPHENPQLLGRPRRPRVLLGGDAHAGRAHPGEAGSAPAAARHAHVLPVRRPARVLRARGAHHRPQGPLVSQQHRHEDRRARDRDVHLVPRGRGRPVANRTGGRRGLTRGYLTLRAAPGSGGRVVRPDRARDLPRRAA
jgi:integrase